MDDMVTADLTSVRIAVNLKSRKP